MLWAQMHLSPFHGSFRGCERVVLSWSKWPCKQPGKISWYWCTCLRHSDFVSWQVFNRHCFHTTCGATSAEKKRFVADFRRCAGQLFTAISPPCWKSGDWWDAYTGDKQAEWVGQKISFLINDGMSGSSIGLMEHLQLILHRVVKPHWRCQASSREGR